MKLQVAFDIPDLPKSLEVAQAIEPHTDIFEIGMMLIYTHGKEAVIQFRERFPQKILLIDAKIIDRPKDAVTLFAQVQADWITVMAGAGRSKIHTAVNTAREMGKKIMLDLADASSPGQSALEAKSFGADALIFHKPTEKTSPETEAIVLLDRWEMVRGNTSLPVFIAGNITRDNIAELLPLSPHGLIIGSAIVNASDPATEAAYFAELLGR